uniref:OSJNBb0066J23.18 protein n=1 Tax=Oryza sativa subsp. japonica TaxID=39947 RepID=Q7X7H6_ORYSJ|nr:OSJNBb0066J23.18 [Oryza sativa Japonica Group]
MDKSETVKQMSLKPLEYSFFLPLSVQAYEEFLALENEMIQLHLQMSNGDRRSYIWNSERPLVWLWKICCVMKTKPEMLTASRNYVEHRYRLLPNDSVGLVTFFTKMLLGIFLHLMLAYMETKEWTNLPECASKL